MKKWKLKITLIAASLTLLGLINGFSKTSQEKEIISKRPALPGNVPITIYEGIKPIKISLEDIAKFHGDICPCVVIAFRSMQKAFLCLCPEGNPRRDDFKVITANPSDGMQDTFDFVTRAKTGENRMGDFKVEMAPGSSAKKIVLDNYTFTFKRKSTGKTVVIKIRKEVFPKNFFKLREKVKCVKNPLEAAKVRKSFMTAKKILKDRFISWPCNKLFRVFTKTSK